jgi:hypothetical protein
LNKADPPTSFGVFKPVGHILIAFRTVNQLQSATDLLIAQGFEVADLTRYSPQEMIAQVDQDLLEASPLASLGHELDFIRAHRTLAESGCHFLVVQAEGDEKVELVAHIARTAQAVRAQRYGRLVIEEIIDQEPSAEAGS